MEVCYQLSAVVTSALQPRHGGWAPQLLLLPLCSTDMVDGLHSRCYFRSAVPTWRMGYTAADNSALQYRRGGWAPQSIWTFHFRG